MRDVCVERELGVTVQGRGFMGWGLGFSHFRPRGNPTPGLGARVEGDLLTY